jgi:hypothetical protein
MYSCYSESVYQRSGLSVQRSVSATVYQALQEPVYKKNRTFGCGFLFFYEKTQINLHMCDLFCTFARLFVGL